MFHNNWYQPAKKNWFQDPKEASDKLYAAQKERKPRTSVGARSIVGLFGGARAFVFKVVRAKTIP